MSNFEDMKYPEVPTLAYHVSVDTAFLYSSLEDIDTQQNFKNINKLPKKLEPNTPLIVLEERIGPDFSYDKVKNFNTKEIGYINSDKVVSLPNITKPSCPVNNNIIYSKKKFEKEIDWEKQKINIPIMDYKNGNYCIVYDTGKEKINGDIKNIMSESIIKGLSIIFSDLGKTSNEEYISSLQNKYYLFASADKVIVPIRNCSTIRILVSVPMRYVESSAVEDSVQDEDLEQSENNSPPEPPKFEELVFRNYKEFEDTCNEIKQVLGAVDILYKSRKWIITPSEVFFEPQKYIKEIDELKKSINKLIFSNITINQLTQTTNLKNLNIFKEKKVPFEGAQRWINYWNVFFPSDSLTNYFDRTPHWEGKLVIKFNQEKNISLINFYDINNKEIRLANGLISFFEQESLKSKSTINYVYQRYTSKFKEKFVEFYIAEIESVGNYYDEEQEKSGSYKLLTKKKLFDLTQYNESLLNDPELAKWVDEVNKNTEKKDQFFSPIVEIFNPEGSFTSWIKTNHYPKIETITAPPLDIGSCVQESGAEFSAAGKKLQGWMNDDIKGAYEAWSVKLKEDKDKQIKFEGPEWKKILENINDLAPGPWKVLLGLQPPPEDYTALQQVNYYYDAVKESRLAEVLAAASTCAMKNIDTQSLKNLLNSYNAAKKALENVAYSTVCNPYLTEGLKKFNSLELPKIPINNPNASLIDQLEKFFAKLIIDVITKLIDATIKSLIAACLDGKNPNDQGNSPLLEGLANSPNFQEQNDLLNDLYGDIPEENIDEATDKLQDLVSSMNCLLTTSEICQLLKGNVANADVYDELIRVIRAKAPELSTKLSSHDDIRLFFLKIAKLIDEDEISKLCPDNSSNDNLDKTGCDDSVQIARETILSNKGLPPEVIKAIVDDMKEKDKKNLEEILKFLNSDEPFDLTNFPSALCKKNPDGSITPAAIDATISVESFKATLENMTKDIYNSFDTDTDSWKKTLYSIKSEGPSFLEFKDNKIQPKTLSPDDLKQKTLLQEKEILPQYLFNKILTNTIEKSEEELYTFDLDESGSYFHKVNIPGKFQEELDINLITDELREEVNKANENLKLFLGEFFSLLTSYLTNVGIKSAVDLSKGKYVNIFKNLSRLDDFARRQDDSTITIKEVLKEVSGNQSYTDIDYLEQTGVSVYLIVANLINSEQQDFKKFITEMGSDANLSKLAEDSIKRLDEIIKQYTKVSGYYKVVFNSTITYPDFNVIYSEKIPKNITGSLDKDYWELNITNNLKNFIKITDYSPLDKDAVKEINNLNISSDIFNKKEIFKKYLLQKNPQFNHLIDDKIYENLTKKIHSCLLESISKNNIFFQQHKSPFGGIKLKDPSDPNKELKEQFVYLPYTDFFIAKIKQTDKQLSCKIRPHYLDIDDVKEQAVENKKKNSCSDIVVSQHSLNNLPVSSNSLKDLETDDNQNIILLCLHKIIIRIFIDDITLRGLGVFGYFDPQLLRDDELMIDFISSIVKAEIKLCDNIYYELLMSFLQKINNLKDPQSEESKISNEKNNEIFKKFISEELKLHSLPKLAKRIMEDTNSNLLNLSSPSGGNVVQILLNRWNSYLQLVDCIGIADQFEYDADEKKLYLILKNARDFTQERESTTVQVQQVNTKLLFFDGNIEDFNDSNPLFRLMFENIFPIKKYITILFITNVLSSMTKPETIRVFKGTKNIAIQTAKIVTAGGQPIIPDPNNAQDLENSNPYLAILSFIIDSILKTPFDIAKGFIESTDPNVAVSSGIYKLVKSLYPDIQPTLIPALGIPAASLGTGTPFQWNPLNVFYYTIGLWNEKKDNRQKDKELEDAAKQVSDVDCSDVKNQDKIVLNDKLLYDIKPSGVRSSEQDKTQSYSTPSPGNIQNVGQVGQVSEVSSWMDNQFEAQDNESNIDPLKDLSFDINKW